MEILKYIDSRLVSWGIDPSTADAMDHFIALFLLLLLAFAADALCRHVVLKGVARLVKKTRATWDDIVFQHKVMVRLSHIVVPLIVYLFLPVAFADVTPVTIDLVQRICYALIILAVLNFGHAFFNAVYVVYNDKPQFRDRPLKSILQTVQMAMWFIGVIVILGKLINQDPLALLAGLGAVATVLMLVFKDSIVGFVSGVQLTTNQMLKVGDWIKVPKHGADGVVIEVSLVAVKVRNWDNTITTVPPYALVSDSFENWNAMRESGGRRVKRSIFIDMDTIRILRPNELEYWHREPMLKSFFQPDCDLRASGENPSLGSDDDPLPAGCLTNLTLYRAYAEAYLRSLPVVNASLHCMVRHLQPTDHGLPLEVYFFSRRKEWVPYEHVQADVFEYLIALLSQFGLRAFQNPSGQDLRAIASIRQ